MHATRRNWPWLQSTTKADRNPGNWQKNGPCLCHVSARTLCLLCLLEFPRQRRERMGTGLRKGPWPQFPPRSTPHACAGLQAPCVACRRGSPMFRTSAKVSTLSRSWQLGLRKSACACQIPKIPELSRSPYTTLAPPILDCSRPPNTKKKPSIWGQNTCGPDCPYNQQVNKLPTRPRHDLVIQNGRK